MIKRYKIQITGKVQGVWYRASTQRKAQELGLSGWVRNESDGSVLVEAQGPAQQLDDLVAWCKEGPTHAHVIDVVITEIPMQESNTFTIIR